MELKDVLPRLRSAPRAAAKLRALADSREVSYAGYRGLSDRCQSAQAERRDARDDARDAESRRVPDEMERAQQALVDAHAECERLDGLRAAAEARTQAMHAILDRACRHVLDVPPDARIRDHAPKGAAPRPADWPAALDETRTAVTELRDEIRRVESAPVPADEARARAKEEMANLIAAGRPDVSGLFAASPAPITWPSVKEGHPVFGTGGMAQVTQVNVPAVLAWLAGPKTLASRIEQEIDATAPADGEAVPSAERAAMLAKLAGRLLAAERIEEAIISGAAEAGTELPRRPDANPVAVLGIEITEAGASSAAA